RADMLLGVASVPLAPLLHDCWVDGQAPVCALLVQPGPGSGASPAEERIQVMCSMLQLSVLALPAQPPISTLQQLPEYEAAYQLEVWKKEEELKWRAGLRERESQRMAVLEAEWRKRERSREAEIAAMRGEFVALEDRARQ
ncbi:uncharacterized protein HaLaN_31217, partial [Haematococcus lacustris]